MAADTQRWLERIRAHRLFQRDVATLTPWQIVGWWEWRRPAFNLIVGTTGVVAILLSLLAGLVSEIRFGTQFSLPDPPIFGIVLIVFYAAAANVCYTGGWIGEIVLLQVWKDGWKDYGPVMLALGTTFSVVVTLIPAFLSIALTVVQFFTGPLPWGAPE